MGGRRKLEDEYDCKQKGDVFHEETLGMEMVTALLSCGDRLISSEEPITL
jgi:hypothetical protein